MVERRTCDPVSRVRVPAGAAGEYSSPGSAFCSLISVTVTAVAIKNPGHSAKSAGNMHTAKHAYMASSKVTLQTGAWLHGVHRTCAEAASVPSGTSHVAKSNNAATTLVDI